MCVAATHRQTLSFFLNRTEDTRDREDPDRAARRDMRLFRISKGDVKTYGTDFPTTTPLISTPDSVPCLMP